MRAGWRMRAMLEGSEPAAERADSTDAWDDADDDPVEAAPAHANTPPVERRSLSAQLGDEDVIDGCLMYATPAALRQCKAVSMYWRERARRTLCAPGYQQRTHGAAAVSK